MANIEGNRKNRKEQLSNGTKLSLFMLTLATLIGCSTSTSASVAPSSSNFGSPANPSSGEVLSPTQTPEVEQEAFVSIVGHSGYRIGGDINITNQTNDSINIQPGVLSQLVNTFELEGKYINFIFSPSMEAQCTLNGSTAATDIGACEAAGGAMQAVWGRIETIPGGFDIFIYSDFIETTTSTEELAEYAFSTMCHELGHGTFRNRGGINGYDEETYALLAQSVCDYRVEGESFSTYTDHLDGRVIVDDEGEYNSFPEDIPISFGP